MYAHILYCFCPTVEQSCHHWLIQLISHLAKTFEGTRKDGEMQVTYHWTWLLLEHHIIILHVPVSTIQQYYIYQSAPYNNTTCTSQHHTTILHVPLTHSLSTIQPYYMYQSAPYNNTTCTTHSLSTIQQYYMYQSASYNHTTCTSQQHRAFG